MLHGKCLTTSRDARRRPRRRRHRTQRTPRTRFRTAHMSRRCLRACHPRRHDVAEPLAPARVLHMTARTHGLGFTPHLHLRASGRWAPQASSLISRWGLTSATCSIVLSTRSDMPLKNERPRCMNMALNAPPRERELYHGAHVHRIERPIAAHTAAVLALLPAERELFTEGYRPSELANRTGDAVG